MILLRLFFIVGLAWLLVGCEKKSIPFTYRPDVQQGNVVTKEMLDRLQPGMEKRKVRFLLGTPLIVDTFNQDQWDYIYTFNPLFGDDVQRRVSLFFEDQRLKNIEGDIKRLEGIEQPATKDRVVTVPKRSPDDGIVVTLLNPINPFSEDEAPRQAGKDEFDAEADGEQADQEEPGFFERMKNAFDSKDEPGTEEADDEPAPEQEEPDTETAAVEPQDDPADDQPGLFERMKKVFESDDAPETDTAEQEEEAPAQPEASPPEAETAALAPEAETEADDEQPGFFDRMKKVFTQGQQPETQAPTATEPEPEPEPEQPPETAKAPAQTEPESESEEGLFDKVKKAFTTPQSGEDEAMDSADSAQPPPQEPPPAASAGSQDEDGGFFRRLAERFRLSIGLDEEPEKTPETAAEEAPPPVE